MQHSDITKMIHFNDKLRPRQQYSSNAPSTHHFHKHGISPSNNSAECCTKSFTKAEHYNEEKGVCEENWK